MSNEKIVQYNKIDVIKRDEAIVYINIICARETSKMDESLTYFARASLNLTSDYITNIHSIPKK